MSDTARMAGEGALAGKAADVRIAEMRRLLGRMRVVSTSEALRALRNAFPDAPLDERVQALKRQSH